MSGVYTIGRGKLYFDRFVAGTKTKTGERYLGNTPEINSNTESDILEHFDSDAGIRSRDDQVTLEIKRTLSFTCDNIDDDNLALFFLADKSTHSQASASAQDTSYDVATAGTYYQAGATALNPSGARGISAVTVKDKAGAVTYVLDTDYTVDAAMGRVYLLPGFTGIAASGLKITATYAANTRPSIITANSITIDGALRFVANNPKGNQRDYYWPYVQLTPNGDYSFKGDDWQALPFTCDVLKLDDDTSAMYIDGRPA
jgi:hypothetical protein